jgi:hypothetical protein
VTPIQQVEQAKVLQVKPVAVEAVELVEQMPLKITSPRVIPVLNQMT